MSHPGAIIGDVIMYPEMVMARTVRFFISSFTERVISFFLKGAKLIMLFECSDRILQSDWFLGRARISYLCPRAR